MPYIPNNDEDRRRMFEKIGVSSFGELLKPIPENLRLTGKLNLPEPLGEMELLVDIEKKSRLNKGDLSIFAGGGVYDHFIPSAVNSILTRPEFMTAYTPYQAEVAQGTLQVIYEFQSHICNLTGMEIANASMYDGASAAAEAASLAIGKTKRNKIVLSDALSPLSRDVINLYLSGRAIEIVIAPTVNGVTDLEKLNKIVDDNTACVIMGQPNFFGLLEDIDAAVKIAHENGALMVAAVDPIAAMLIKTPADCGVDIVVGEGQPLGIPLNFGGPLLGFFAVNKPLIRSIPGRLAARTEDVDGRPGFVLTLQTREQHIRRDRATSNICTNQALCATMATVSMSLMGKSGLKQAALLSMEKSHRAFEEVCRLDKFEPYFDGGNFVREFAIKTPIPAKEIIDKLIADHSILPGISLDRFYSNMEDGLLMTVTEKRSEEEVDCLIKALGEL